MTGIVNYAAVLALVAHLSLFASSLCSGSDEIDRDSPRTEASELRVTQLSELLHLDIGDIFVHQDNLRTITLVNSMDFNLEVVEIERSCGCVKAHLGEALIRKHGSSQLKLSVRPTEVTDKFRKKVTIRLSRPAGTLIEIAVEARVLGPVAIEPSTLRFSDSARIQEVTLSPGAPTTSLLGCESLRNVLAIDRIEQMSGGGIKLSVRAAGSVGQAIEVLRTRPQLSYRIS